MRLPGLSFMPAAFGVPGAPEPTDLTLTAQWDFTMGSLVAVAGRGPTLSFTRATTATYWDANGVLQTAASGDPRFDHDPVDGTPLGLLIEEERENEAFHSEDFTNTDGWSILNASRNANQAVAPDGNTTADEIVENGFTAQHFIFVANGVFSGDGSTEYCFSVFLKKGDGSSAPDIMQVTTRNGGFADDIYVDANLSTGAITATGSVNDSGIIDAGNGWYRVWFTATSDAAEANAGLIVGFCNDNSTATKLPSYLGSTDANAFVWGAQMEAGAFPTSYIPTTTASVTRNADVVSTTTVDWYENATGTFYVKYRTDFESPSYICEMSDNSLSDRIALKVTTVGRAFLEGISAAGDNLSVTTGNNECPLEQINEVAGAYATDDCAISGNGNTAKTDTIYDPWTVDAQIFAVGYEDTGGDKNFLNGWLQEIRYYNVRKSDSFLESITS